MISLTLSDMTCGRSAGIVARAVTGVDPGATVRIDVRTRRVDIDPVRADAYALIGAIRNAGYTLETFGNSALTVFPWAEFRDPALG